MKLIISFMLAVSTVCFADMAMNQSGVSAKMASLAPPMVYKLNVLKSNLHAKRTLSETEKKIQDLLSLADLLKMTEISSYSRTPESTDLNAMTTAIRYQIQKDPKWANKVSVDKLNADSLKASLGEKSYAWAWILKQKGDTIGSKKILTELFKEGSEGIMNLTSLHDDSSLQDMMNVQEALAPMSTKAEGEAMDAKMQKMKIHISNLPDSRMMT